MIFQQNSSEAGSDDSKKDQELNESITPQARKGRKGKNKIPRRALLILKNWLTEHFNDPYPNTQEKLRLARDTGITLKQVIYSKEWSQLSYLLIAGRFKIGSLTLGAESGVKPVIQRNFHQ